MIIIPTGTDAPIYHWPYVTVGMIVLNVALAFLVPPEIHGPALDEDGEVVEEVQRVTNFDRYSLALGDGRLHPVQWVTHNFLHYGLIHVAGNMVFLWAFGIVVEGKLGPLKYLIAYLAIGTLHGAVTQVLFLKSGLDAHAAGASAVIYGLLAACMIWAPRNELNCMAIFIVGFRTFVFHWDLYYTTVAILYCRRAGVQPGAVRSAWRQSDAHGTGPSLRCLLGRSGRGLPTQGRSGRLRGMGLFRALRPSGASLLKSGRNEAIGLIARRLRNGYPRRPTPARSHRGERLTRRPLPDRVKKSAQRQPFFGCSRSSERGMCPKRSRPSTRRLESCTIGPRSLTSMR